MSQGFAIYRTSLGFIRIEHSDNKLCGLRILSCKPNEMGLRNSFTDMVIEQVEQYLCSKRKSFDIALDLEGCTAFQQRVYGALLEIPYGETLSYGSIAESIGNAKAARAVGLANNRNPIHIIIPCHRVVGKTGSLTGYAAGLDVKLALLTLEGYLPK